MQRPSWSSKKGKLKRLPGSKQHYEAISLLITLQTSFPVYHPLYQTGDNTATTSTSQFVIQTSLSFTPYLGNARCMSGLLQADVGAQGGKYAMCISDKRLEKPLQTTYSNCLCFFAFVLLYGVINTCFLAGKEKLMPKLFLFPFLLSE